MDRVYKKWETDRALTGDLVDDCVQMVTDSITRVGFSNVRTTPFQGVITCDDDNTGSAVVMDVELLPVEEWDTPLEEIGERVSTMPEYLGSLRSLADVIKVTSNLQEPVRCDLSCVCLNVIDDRFRVRVHHLRGVAHA